MNIALCGFMGAGKTVVGKELAKITGRKFVDTDEMIEEKTGISIPAIFAARGEEYFRELEFEICKKTAELKNAVISTGGGALTFDFLKTEKMQKSFMRKGERNTLLLPIL